MDFYFDEVPAKDLMVGQTVLQLKNPKSTLPVLCAIRRIDKKTNHGALCAEDLVEVSFGQNSPGIDFVAFEHSLVLVLSVKETHEQE